MTGRSAPRRTGGACRPSWQLAKHRDAGLGVYSLSTATYDERSHKSCIGRYTTGEAALRPAAVVRKFKGEAL